MSKEDATQQGIGSSISPSQAGSGRDSEAKIVTAKRKYWVEWQCLLDKFPVGNRLEVLKADLKREYIRKYLDDLYDKKRKLLNDKNFAIFELEDKYNKDDKVDQDDGHKNLLNNTKEQFNNLFLRKKDESETDKYGQMQDPVAPLSDKDIIEFKLWDKGIWRDMTKLEYFNYIKQHPDLDGLRQIIYSRKWIDNFDADWERVSDSHLIFSFRSWFITRNNIRLTPESKSSMNPPDPPPPPR